MLLVKRLDVTYEDVQMKMWSHVIKDRDIVKNDNIT